MNGEIYCLGETPAILMIQETDKPTTGTWARIFAYAYVWPRHGRASNGLFFPRRRTTSRDIG